ncbi:hypothetical protein ACJBU6_03574 [Exserohilum turcicum]
MDSMSATTPHRPNMASYQTPSQTPARRVLGSLTPKALNTPQTQTKPYELAHVAPRTPAAFADKENLATPNATVKSKKRGIQEVDDAETIAHAKMLAHARGHSPSTTAMRLTADAIQKHTENNPIGLADPGSPTERATPSPSPEPEAMHASQKSNQSFSDFLNYEMCASQKSDHAKLAPLVAEEKKRSRAEQLRTRLKFGLYKVKTNQVSKRDVDIIAPFEASSMYSSNPLASTTMTSSGDSRVPNITVSSPRREQGPVFVQANLDPFRPISKLGPAPVQFAPPQGGMVSSRTIEYEITSSPPGTDLPKSVTPEELTSPMQQRNHYQMASEPRRRGGEHGADSNVREESARERLQRLRQQQYLEETPSSIRVQGDAAEGLLQLMQNSR